MLPSVQAAGSSSTIPESTCNPSLQELRLHVIDHKTDIKFLVDSGSIVSLLPLTFATRKSSPRALKLSAANGPTISTYGQRLLAIDLSLGRILPWAFIVADVKSAILGADLLAHYGLVVDLKRHCIADSSSPDSIQGIFQEADIFDVDVVSPRLQSAKQLQLSIGELVKRYSTLLQRSSAPSAGPMADVKHHIVTSGPPVFSRPRRLMGEKLKAAKQDFDLLLFHGVIRPSGSQWASPLHLVAKAGGGWRSTGDFRRLNAMTVPDRYPIPRIEDLLLSLHGSKVFTKLDLNRAYFQVPVAPEDVPKSSYHSVWVI